jgi:protein-disulfide isomerase
MKKIYLGLLAFASLSFADIVVAADTPVAKPQQATTHFSSEQVTDIKKIMTEYLIEHPDIVMTAFQAGMAEKQKEEVATMEKAVIENKDKIFKNPDAPTAGNHKDPTQALVVFMDPYCGYCKKFHGEIDTILSTNKDVKITFVDIPIMGPGSSLAVKAMLAAKIQGKYDQLQKALFTTDKHLSKKQILKIAKSLGIDTKQLETDMKSKGIQAQINRNSELAKVLGINGTPTLIIGEGKVVPGFLRAEEVNKMLKETTLPVAETQPTSEKAAGTPASGTASVSQPTGQK